MLKKILAVLLALLMVFALAACGEETTEEKETADGNSATVGGKVENGFLFAGYGNDEPAVELGTPEKTLNPDDVYGKVKYAPEMFDGDYGVIGGDYEKFAKEHSFVKYQIDGEECELSVVPFRMRTGDATMAHTVNYIKEHDWTEVTFAKRTEDGEIYIDIMICKYVVEGNKIIFTPLVDYKFDEANNKIEYALADVTIECEYKFKGRTLTLTNGGESVTLTGGMNSDHTADYLCVDNYLAPNSKSIDGVDALDFRYDSEDNEGKIYFETINEESSYTSTALLSEDGLFTFTLALENSTKTYQFVYFYGGDDGIILTDGENYYYYTDTYSERNKNNLNEYVTDDQTGKLDKLSDAQLEAIVTKKENLLEDLAKAFEDAGIKVSVDSKTGELAMDSSVLFGGDSAVLTDDGKALLNKFVDAYTSIVFSEKYDGFVSKTMVEGHTAPVAGSTYESGLPLSEERANNVKNYCVSADTGVDTTKLAAALEAIGYSNSKPVKDANGAVDMAASRRVSFRFIINIG